MHMRTWRADARQERHERHVYTVGQAASASPRFDDRLMSGVHECDPDWILVYISRLFCCRLYLYCLCQCLSLCWNYLLYTTCVYASHSFRFDRSYESFMKSHANREHHDYHRLKRLIRPVSSYIRACSWVKPRFADVYSSRTRELDPPI